MREKVCDGRKCGTGNYIGGGKWVCQHNNLKTLYPKFCEEWDYEKNNKDPSEYLYTSSQNVWWKCKNDPCGCHFWRTKISHRTKTESGCPFCKIGKVCPHNNLTITHPDLCKEWDFENNDLPPEKYSRGSKKKVWWKCLSNNNCDCHRWESRVVDRTLGRTQCPFCIKNLPCEHYNLTITHPDLCKEWDFETNELPPEKYSPKSRNKVWWKCQANNDRDCQCHRWESLISDRTLRGKKCPFCIKDSPCKHYNLKLLYPDICKTWDYNNNTHNPEDYSPNSKSTVWWETNLHKFSLPIRDMVHLQKLYYE